MNEITVIISGIVLLVSSNAYLSSGTDVISSAIAVEAGQPMDSQYDIDIPLHEAMLIIPAEHVTFTTDPDKRIESREIVTEQGEGGQEPPMVMMKVLRLRGDRIQMGRGGTACSGAAAQNTMTRDSARTLPRFGEIIGPHVSLADRTFPTGQNFTRMNETLVAAWLDIRGGHLRPVHSPDGQAFEEVEFRPSRRRARLAPQVHWTLPAQEVDCIVITPFRAALGSPIVIGLQPETDIEIHLENMADPATGEVIPGIGYDYELFRKVIANYPAIPPIPYALQPVEAPPETSEFGPDVFSGVNCGPPRIQ